MPVLAVLHHLDPPFLGNAEAPLRAAGLDLDERFLAAGDSLPDLDEVDGILALGGVQSAVDVTTDPLLTAETRLLRGAVERGVPVFGICLGGQVLSRALGGTVRPARRRSVTWRELGSAEPRDPLFGAHAAVPALHWNQDIFTLPPGAVELLRAPEPDGVEAFRFGDHAWGIQFHPEVDGTVLDDWYGRYGVWLEQAGVAEADARALDARWLDRQSEVAAGVFAAFARLVISTNSARFRGTVSPSA